jgi:hypothetical protein
VAPVGPIHNASDTLLTANPGTLPNVQEAMASWFQTLTFTKIVKTVVNFNAVEVRTNFAFQGVRQPFTSQQLMMKPEGQRKWKWEMIHAYPDLVLQPDEIIIFNGLNYRVMQKYDYTEYGYVQYDIVQDYQ